MNQETSALAASCSKDRKKTVNYKLNMAMAMEQMKHL